MNIKIHIEEDGATVLIGVEHEKILLYYIYKSCFGSRNNIQDTISSQQQQTINDLLRNHYIMQIKNEIINCRIIIKNVFKKSFNKSE